MCLSSDLGAVNFAVFVPALSEFPYMAFEKSVNYSVKQALNPLIL